jgi:hypothetical protein
VSTWLNTVSSGEHGKEISGSRRGEIFLQEVRHCEEELYIEQLFRYLSIYLSIHLSIYPSIHPSIYLYVGVPVCLSIYLSIYIFVCLLVYVCMYVFICIPIYGITAIVDLGRFFSFLIYTVGRTPWTGDQPVARQLSKHRTIQS